MLLELRMTVPAMLGPYPIERELGRGGMGVVYLGRDPRLNRPVAIKIIPDALAQNPDNLARFEREARLLAAVNHPNIASVYGVEEADGHRMLVMEYVAGETLGDRLSRGPLPIAEALDIGRQVASGIEAAHEGGIVHRDLKPGNVRVTPDGVVKVLDFGLAKGGMTANAELAQSPTLTYSPTGLGVILGTAGYMSPEQARGKAVDRRADIWAFGCLLFESLTARKIFEGETVSDTIARILESEPPWTDLPAATPPRVRELLRRCLEKDLKKRQRDIGDVRIELEEAIAASASSSQSGRLFPAAETRPKTWVRAATAMALVVVGAAVGIVIWNFAGFGTRTPASGPVNLSVAMPSNLRAGDASFARDGRSLIVRGSYRRPDGTDDPVGRLFLRSLDSYELKPIAGTEGLVAYVRSPDGKWLAVLKPVSEQSVEQRLWRISVDGSAPPSPVVDWDRQWAELIWLEDGSGLIHASLGTKLLRVPMSGGSPTQPIALTLEKGAGYPSFRDELPGGRGVLMQVEGWGPRGYELDVWLLNPSTGKATRLIESAGHPTYLETTRGAGHILFSRGNALMSVPFDLSTLKIGTEAIATFDGLRSNTWDHGFFQVSANGHLLFEPGGRLGVDRKLVVVSSTREVTPFMADARPFEAALSVSSDGRQVAVVVPNARGTYEVWLGAKDRPGLRRALTFPNADSSNPEWSPNGAWLAFSRNGRDMDDGAYIQRTDGTAAARTLLKVTSLDQGVGVVDWAGDGSGVFLSRQNGSESELLYVPVSAAGEPGPAKPVPISKGFQGRGQVSPNGKLLAFLANDSGSNELYVVGLNGAALSGDPLVVTSGGGSEPRWSADSRRLYFRKPPSLLMSVAIDAAPTLRAAAPALVHDLKPLRLNPIEWDILPDGRLIGIQMGAGEDDVTSYSIVLNWLDSVRAKLK